MHDIVVAAARQDCRQLRASWKSDAADDAVALAIEQRIPGLLTTTAATAGIAHSSLRRATAASRDATMSHLGMLAALRELDEIFTSSVIRWWVLKGPVLQERAWRVLPRPYDDLDVLVARNDMERALGCIEAAGGAVVDRNWRKLAGDRLAEVHCMLPGGALVDLHWHLVNDGNARHHFRLDMEEMARRGRVVSLSIGPVATLDPTDTVVHLALHAAISGGHRLVWLVDLAMTIAADPPDWDEVVERTLGGRVALPVAAMLHRAATTVDAAVPEGLTRKLVDATESALVHRLGTWRPSGRLPGGASPDRPVSRSLRAGLPSTTGEVLGELWAMGRRMADRTEWWAETSDPRHVVYAAGTRPEYLASIAGVDRFGNTA